MISMAINKTMMALARDYRATRTNPPARIGAEMALEAGLLQECLIDEDANIEFVSESDCGPFIGIQLTNGKGIIINYATGELSEY